VLGDPLLADALNHSRSQFLTSTGQNRTQAGSVNPTAIRAGEAVARKLGGLSLADVGPELGKLKPKERIQLEAAVRSGSVNSKEILGAMLLGASAAAQLTLLKGLPRNTLDELRVLVRGGTNPNMALSVTIEVAAQTAWGKAHPPVLEKLRKAHTEYRVQADLAQGLGWTDGNVIKVNPEMLKCPEAMAAVLAHQGTHLHQGTPCCGGLRALSLAGETAGSVAAAMVWDEIGMRWDSTIPNQLELLNGPAAALKTGGEKAVLALVGQAYIKTAEEKIRERKSDATNYTPREPDDTMAAWEARARGFREEVAAATAKK